MKTPLFSVLVISAFAAFFYTPLHAQSAFKETVDPSTPGIVLPQEYWFAPIQNATDLPGKSLELTIGSEQNTVAYVQFGAGKVLTVPLTAYRDSVIVMPLAEEMKSSGIVEEKAVHVWTDGAGVICQFSSSVPASSDAMRILPMLANDTEFVVAAFATPDGFRDQPSEFSITARTDSTIINITPSCDLRYSKTFGVDSQRAFAAKVPFQIVLNRGECIQFQSALGYGEGLLDVTGTIIHSNHPLAIVGGSMRPQIPDASQPPASYVCEMIPPVGAWGTTYYSRYTNSFESNSASDDFLFIGSKAGQTYFWRSCAEGAQQVQAQNNSIYGVVWAELNIPSKVWSDAPFLLAEYTNGDRNGSLAGSIPSEVVLTPVRSFKQRVLFQGSAPTSINIFYNKKDSNVLLDGYPIPRYGSICLDDTFQIDYISDLFGLHTIQSDSGADVLLMDMSDSTVSAWSGYPVGSVSTDTVAPGASFTEYNGSCVRVNVSDSGSGLSSFYLDSSANMSLTVDNTFVPGSGRVQSFADLCVNDISKPGSIQFTVFDKAANFSVITVTFDPSLLTSHPGFTVQSLNFDTVLIHTSKTLPLLTVTDSSSEFPIAITNLWTNDPGFIFDRGAAGNSLPDTLAPGQTHTFALTFQPTSDMVYSGKFNVVSGSLPVRAVTVTGTGYSQLAEVSSVGSAFHFDITPNPASNHLLIRYAVPESSVLDFGIYSVLGREVLHWHAMDAGTGEQAIDLRVLPCGVYIYRFQTAAESKSGKLIIEP